MTCSNELLIHVATVPSDYSSKMQSVGAPRRIASRSEASSAHRWKRHFTRVQSSIVALLLGLLVSGCQADSSNERLASAPSASRPGVPPVTAQEWRADTGCLQEYDSPRSWTGCLDNSLTSDFTAVSLSGGGTKATVFGGEALFYLEALGWLQHASMISAVSGGSFAAALYAVSCDMQDTICQSSGLAGTRRPIWNHGEIMRVLGLGNRPLVGE